MRIDGLQNKFEIFQQFYYEINGVEITYNEAVKLYYNMDEATQIDFAQFCADKVEYELLDGDNFYITSASGYGLDKDFIVGDAPVGERARATRKSRKGGKRGEYIWSTNTEKFTNGLIEQKYIAESYAKKNGLILDRQWSQFSAEEIMEMYNDGVNIPQEIVDAAQTELQSKTGNLEGAEGDSDEGEGNGAEKTEKETFLELIPKAKKNIDKCHDKEAKIDEKITNLVQDNGGIEKSFEDKMKEQKATLKEYEEKIREWRVLQNKINNGEELSDTEARRYAQITGMLEDKNSNAAEFKLDKLSIARNLNEINILAVLGEQLADETIEIGDQLADYVSETNYKSTRAQVTGEMGFLRAIIAMLNGKTLAKEANEVGHETKDYAGDAVDSIADIAGLLGVEKMIENPSTQPEEGKPEDVKAAEKEQEEEGIQPEENLPPTENEQETQAAAEEENESVEEDFIINDENVLNLIDLASGINADLLKQIKTAYDNIQKSEDDKNFALFAIKILTHIIEGYEGEEERQKEIEERQAEIDKAQKRIEELGGGEKSEEEEMAEDLLPKGAAEEENPNQDEIDEQQAIIDMNTAIIEALNGESETSIEQLKIITDKFKEKIDKAVPEENVALENDEDYKENIIPEDKEQLAFTLSSGKTLGKMGTYRVKVGIEQILHWQFKKGFRNIRKGSVSIGIGDDAVAVAKQPIIGYAEKSTEASVNNEKEAIKSLIEIDNKITEVTGEDSAEEGVQEEDKEENSVDGENNDENGEGGEGSENGAGDENGTQGDGKTPTVTETAPNQNPALKMSVGKTSKVQNAPKTREEIIRDAKETNKKTSENGEEDDEVSLDSLPKRNKKKDKNEGITDTDKAGEATKEIGKDGKESAKDSSHVLKDTQKDEKQLDKETKKLQKRMKKDEKDIIRMTKESIKAAKKQEEILKRYEELTKENDAIAEEEANKKSTAPAQQQGGAQGLVQGAQTAQQKGMTGATNSFGMTDSSKSSSADNAEKMEANNQEITELDGQFTMAGNKIKRNRKKIVKLQKSTKKNVKKVEKKSKIRNEKIKEAEKKEMEKQKKLAKQLGTVGIAENIFSITLATGEIMLLSPWTAAAGAVLVDIGTYGIIGCGVTKAIINLANGNLTAALIGLAQTAVTVATSVTGVGAAGGSVLTAVSSGLSIVSSSAQLVNNVRAVQGKEANGTLGMISTIAGVASSVTSAASGLGNMGGASALSKTATIANAVGTAVSSVGQLMSEFGGDADVANLLSTIGGGISLAASVTQLATAKKSGMDKQNKENTDQTQQNANNENNNNNNNNNNTKPTNKKDPKAPDAMPTKAKPDTPNSSNPSNNTNDTTPTPATTPKKPNASTTTDATTTPADNSSTTPATTPTDKDKKPVETNTDQDRKQMQEEQNVDATVATPNIAGTTTVTPNEGTTVTSDPVQQDLNAAEANNSAKQEDLTKKNDATTTDATNNANDNQQAEQKTRAQKKEERRTAREALKKQKEKIKEHPELTKEQKRNMKENGASLEYAGVSDAELQSHLEGAMGGEGTDIDVQNIRAEQDRRKQYQDQRQMLKDYKNQKLETIGNVINGVGQAGSAAMSFISMFATSNDTGETKKQRNFGTYDARYLKANKYMATAASNENYFGGGHNDDQKRRFKKFAKRI